MHLLKRQFDRLVRRALDALPQEALGLLENVAIVVQDWPTPDQMRTAEIADRHDLFGLYEGVPLIDREGSAAPLPDKITLFKRPIELACANEEELVQEIRTTLIHEIAHHFGMDEDYIDRLGYA
ncbi:MAG: metallopeptidase family protein [Chloroflexi bacterium]|nr:metallopeptidase family protein [Chloroflexota bacterium]